MRSTVFRLLLIATMLVFASLSAFAGGSGSSNPCPRPAAGSVVQNPPDLFSSRGVLNVTFNYFTTTDADGRTLFCFVTPNGQEGPTLHVHPGDTLNVTVTNKVPPPPAGSPTEVVSNSSNQCGDLTMTQSSLNIHYHGTNTSPACGSDEVIHTIINSGETFKYSLHFPKNEPPGLYWYHPHVHGIAEAAVQGGASGAIIVEGIAAFQPQVAGLPERVLIVRDQVVTSTQTDNVPAWDLTLNYVPIPFPNYPPAVIQMAPGEKELWRVANASADTIIDVQLVFDGKAQTLGVVALDGVPTGSQDGTVPGSIVPMTDILIPPAGRAEFIVTGPSTKVKNAVFQTLNVSTGPAGDNDPQRPLATIQTVKSEPSSLFVIPTSPQPPAWALRFTDVDKQPVAAKRNLYFSEVISDPNNPASPTNFFITVQGATPTLFDANNPPAITTTQGSVEQWTIANQAPEHHEFHMHQIHFLLQQINGKPATKAQQQFFDMYQIPFWDGVSSTFPSITVLMDFRGPDIGDFVYHCHILGHEDNGMMAIIRVQPPTSSSTSTTATTAAATTSSATTSSSSQPDFD